MTELEKINERLTAIEAAIIATQHAATVDRKMSHDKHTNGHFTKALQELVSVKEQLSLVAKRIEAVGR
jgi:translation initiation factor 6 (eIF-6)